MRSFTAIHRDEAGPEREVTELAEATSLIREGRGFTWLHLDQIRVEDAHLLQEDLALDPLAIEDCLNDGYQRPKVDEYPSFTFMLVHGIDYAATGHVVTTAELDVFIGDRWVISLAQVPMPSIDHLIAETRAGRMSLAESPALLVYTLVDALVDSMLPVVDRMDEVTDLIEDEVLSNVNPALIEHLVNLKRSVLRMNRMAVPQAHLLGQIAGGGYPRLEPAAVLFRDVYDHQLWLSEQIVDLRERAAHAVDMYHSALAIRQNETMRVLSIVASIFLPLTLLAGIYGMNFHHMPELAWEPAYYIVVGFMVLVVAVGSYALFGRRMLGWGRDRIGELASFALDPPVVGEAAREAARLRSWVMGGRSSPRGAPPPGEDRDPAP